MIAHAPSIWSLDRLKRVKSSFLTIGMAGPKCGIVQPFRLVILGGYEDEAKRGGYEISPHGTLFLETHTGEY